jgi:hypothetical protein
VTLIRACLFVVTRATVEKPLKTTVLKRNED